MYVFLGICLLVKLSYKFVMFMVVGTVCSLVFLGLQTHNLGCFCGSVLFLIALLASPFYFWIFNAVFMGTLAFLMIDCGVHIC